MADRIEQDACPLSRFDAVVIDAARDLRTCCNHSAFGRPYQTQQGMLREAGARA
jgi:hypothetical protein